MKHFNSIHSVYTIVYENFHKCATQNTHVPIYADKILGALLDLYRTSEIGSTSYLSKLISNLQTTVLHKVTVIDVWTCEQH
jgi:hypothetical protein